MKIAAFTMVYNEPVFLPLWRRYYAAQLGEENLFVLDNGSDDGCAEGLGLANVLRVPRILPHDDTLKAIFVSRCQAALLGHYDAVVFADADEFLIPDPDLFGGLADFIARRCVRLVNPVGLDVHHVPDLEPPIDLARPILAQRRYVRFAFPYCKPIVSRIPLVWDAGVHSCDQPPAIDRDFYLFHLKRMDLGLALRRLQTTRAITWSRASLAKGMAQDHRLADEEFVRRLFPYSAATVAAELMPGFDFSAELAKLPTDRPHYYSSYEGAVALIPPRFQPLIPGIADGIADRIASGPAAPRRRPLPDTPRRARRALRRVIAVNALRDRCRPLAERLRRWLA